jgi:hypothetical protein
MNEDLLNELSYLPLVGSVIVLGVCGLHLLVSSLSQEQQTRSRKTGGSGSAEAQAHLEIMKEIDPIDSVYFDLSVARHMLEDGKKEEAKKWLEAGAAIDELSRSWHAGFITPEEARTKSAEIGKIIDMINANKQEEALRELIRLQDWASEKAYSAYVEEAKKRGIDPPQYLNGRYESAREKKIAEWRAKGVSEGLIEKALLWSDSWARGIARRFIKDPEMQKVVAESIYPEALELSTKYVEAFSKS